ncbi:hypothetical protein GCM10017779_37310 [Streptomyces capillispiralis]|nr:hypothetical protein GCM10017779_37310 [Streptomyces capillispiralis]
MEAVAGEAERGAVEDLPAAGVKVFLGNAGHDRNLKRTFLLDKEKPERDGEEEFKTNDPSFYSGSPHVPLLTATAPPDRRRGGTDPRRGGAGTLGLRLARRPHGTP